MSHPRSHSARVAGALVWEFWARGWRGFLLTQTIILLVQVLIYTLMSWEMRFQIRDTLAGERFYFFLYWPTVVWLGSAILWTLGSPKFRYTLPASSLLLVATPMACAMLAMVLQYAIAAVIVSALFGAQWPILGPAVLAAVIIAWCQVILWSTSNSLSISALVCLICLLAIARWGPSYAYGLTPTAGFLQNFDDRHGWSFALAALASVAVGTAGFARLRHGAIIDLQRIVDELHERFHFLRAPRAKPFSSPAAAQFWLEWRERGYLLPLGATLFGIPALVLAWCQPLSAVSNGDLTAGLLVLTIAPLAAIGFFWGSRSSNLEFRTFGGSRPLSDGQLASAVLKSVTLSLILSAVIWTAFMILVGIIGSARLGAFKMSQPADLTVFLAGTTIVALAAWSAIGLIASVSLAGKKAIGGAFSLVVATFLILNLIGQWGSRQAINGFSIACLVLLVLGCAATFVASWLRDLITWRAFCLSALIVAVAVAASFTLDFDELIADRNSLLCVLAGCSLIPIPLGAAPLAIYVNRHR